MTRPIKTTLIAAGVVALGGVIGLAVYHIPITQRYYTDADTIRTPFADTTPRDVLWQPPIPLRAALNTSAEDYEPRLSWDGLTLFFVRGRAGENADIYTAQRTPAGWTDPTPLAALNTDADELGPEPAPDGSALYFYSDRAGGQGGYDLWVARRGDDGWRVPTNLGPAVNTQYNDYGPAVAPDGRRLYFASNRPPPEETPLDDDPARWPATVREDLFGRTYDLYAAELTDAGVQPAEALADLNTPHSEGAPCISPVGDFLYFASDRAGGAGGFDLYRARLRIGDAARQVAENLGPPLNTPANELDPGLTHLGYALYFSSDRVSPPADDADAVTINETSATVAARERRRDYNLYFSSAREVFADSEQTHRPPLDWAALLRWLWPLLLALLALLTLLALWQLIAGHGIRRRLSLLARCLLASLLLHALAMIGFSFWRVSAALADTFRPGGRTQITLSAAGANADLARQVRGDLTEIETPAPTTPERERWTDTLESVLTQSLAVVAVTDVPPPAPDRRRMEVEIAPSPTDDALESEPDVSLEPVHPTTELHIELPEQSARIADAEPQPDFAPRHAVAVATPRAPVRIATSQPAADLIPVPVAETGSDPLTDDPALSEQSLAAAETSPVPSNTGAQAATQPVMPEPSPRPNIDVALPRETAARVATAPAPPTAVRPADPDNARPDLPELRPTAAAAPSASVEIPVAAADNGVIDRPLDIAHASSVPAAAVGRSLTQTAQPATVAAPSAPALDLTLPSLETAHGAPSQERPAGPVAAAAPLSNRPALALAPAAVTNSGATYQSLAPTGAIETRPRDTAFGALTAPTATDVRAPTVRRQPNANTAADAPAMPTLALDLSLPAEAPAGAADDPAPPPGSISGHVRDMQTDEPLAGAVVHLDQADGDPLTATTDQHGFFELPLPRLPEFVALSASADGYLPATANIPSEQVKRDGLVRDFALETEQLDVIPLERVPQVHHLGNDRWDGRINSQFQKHAEGRRLRAYLELTDTLLADLASASLTLMAKGVQCPHRVYVNGELLDRRLDSSPSDGSFGEFSAPIGAALLFEGLNVIEIRGVSCRGDIDDFELVNIQLRLHRE